MKTMILVILTAAITNNYVLVKFLGICPFWAYPRNSTRRPACRWP